MGFLGGGFFGSGASSSKSNTTSDTTTQNSGFSEIGGNAASINIDLGIKQGKKSRSSNVVNVLDNGAIGKAFDFADSVSDRAMSFSDAIASTSAKTTSEAVAAVVESARSETENLTINFLRFGTYGLLCYAAFKAAVAVWGKNK